MSREAEPRPDERPGSYIQSDAGILLPTERTNAAPGDSYEERRDNEQLGRSRELMLREVDEEAPPPLEVMPQNDQVGRQASMEPRHGASVTQERDY